MALSVAGLSTISGPPAAQGAQAAQAAEEIDTVTKRTGAPVSIGPTLSAQATAKCRRGETLIGGGALGAGTSFQAVFLRASGPDPGNARRWLARGYNNDFGANHDLTAYAMCAKSARRDRVGVIVRSNSVATELAGDTAGNDTAGCRRDERLVSGGARGSGTPPGSMLLTVSAPDPTRARRWLATGYNNGVATETLRAFAFCARPARPDRVERIVKRAGNSVAVAANTEGTATARCRRSERLVGGGALSDVGVGIQGVLLRTSAPDPNNSRRWSTSGFNFDGATSHNLRAVAFCARS
jgi:hypothetical protein